MDWTDTLTRRQNGDVDGWNGHDTPVEDWPTPEPIGGLDIIPGAVPAASADEVARLTGLVEQLLAGQAPAAAAPKPAPRARKAIATKAGK